MTKAIQIVETRRLMMSLRLGYNQLNWLRERLGAPAYDLAIDVAERVFYRTGRVMKTLNRQNSGIFSRTAAPPAALLGFGSAAGTGAGNERVDNRDFFSAGRRERSDRPA